MERTSTIIIGECHINAEANNTRPRDICSLKVIGANITDTSSLLIMMQDITAWHLPPSIWSQK